jgi:DNA repair/transcription protein MET18/MMS19
MYSSDTTIEGAALSALESLVAVLYPTEADAPTGLAQDIIKQCLHILQEPEKSQGIAATKALAVLVRASREPLKPIEESLTDVILASAGKFALSQALPEVFRQFNRPALPSHRPAILSTITTLLIAARSVYPSPDPKRHQGHEKSLEPFRESLSDVLREGLRTDGLKTSAVRGCVALVEIPDYWAKGEVEDVVRGMDDVLINDRDPEVR